MGRWGGGREEAAANTGDHETERILLKRWPDRQTDVAQTDTDRQSERGVGGGGRCGRSRGEKECVSSV